MSKNITYFVKKSLMQDDEGVIHDMDDASAWAREDAVSDMGAMEDDSFHYQPMTSSSHFTALNCLPVVAGTKWAVSEKIYWEFLEMLPPLGDYRGGFVMSEPDSGSIHSAYYKSGGSYWHEYIDIKEARNGKA